MQFKIRFYGYFNENNYKNETIIYIFIYLSYNKITKNGGQNNVL